MRIRNIFLSAFIVLSYLIPGLSYSAENKEKPLPVTTQQVAKTAIAGPKKAANKIRSKANAKASRKAAIAAHNNGKSAAVITSNAVQKPLDLSVPFTDIDKSGQESEADPELQFQKTTIFAKDSKKKTRPIELDGNLLMSQEPEAEKRKSADGAGIIINLKP